MAPWFVQPVFPDRPHHFTFLAIAGRNSAESKALVRPKGTTYFFRLPNILPKNFFSNSQKNLNGPSNAPYTSSTKL